MILENALSRWHSFRVEKKNEKENARGVNFKYKLLKIIMNGTQLENDTTA